MCSVTVISLLLLAPLTHAEDVLTNRIDNLVDKLVNKALVVSPLYKGNQFLVPRHSDLIAAAACRDRDSNIHVRPFTPTPHRPSQCPGLVRPFFPTPILPFLISHSALPIHRSLPERLGGSDSVATFDGRASELVGGLPFASSVQKNARLTWMEAVLDQFNMMHDLGFEKVEIDTKFALQTNDAKPARIVNMQFKSKVIRKARMTYFDAGDKVQVTNTVFYPSYEYDLPLFGIDLISLGRKRVLAGIDFMPLYSTKEYSDKYIERLTSIKAKYKGLQGNLSGRIYDDTSTFSKNMLFGRYSNETKVESEILPACREYIQAFEELIQNAVADTSEAGLASVKARQIAYDTYHAEADPAVGLFETYFGKEWSNIFVHDFLFELAGKAEAGQDK